MGCRLDTNLIQEYVEHRLGEVESMILEEHIRNCKVCKEELDDMKSLFQSFDNLRGDIDIPDGLMLVRNQILNSLEHLDSRRSFGVKEFARMQKAVLKGAGIFAGFIPGLNQGAKYVKKGVRKTPGVIYKTLSFAFKGSLKLIAARSKT